MSYLDLETAEKTACEQITRDFRAWAKTFYKLLQDGQNLREAYDNTLVPIMNTHSVQGAEIIPNTSALPGSDPNFSYGDLVTLAGYTSGDANSLDGVSGGDWDEASKINLYIRAGGPLG